MLYRRPELRLLVALAAILLCGLAVREWRAGFPDLADRVERFDQDDAQAPATADARPERSAAATASEEAETAPTGAAVPATEPGVQLDSGRALVEPGGPRLDNGRAQVDRTVVEPPADPRPLDLNRATLAELSRLPGVGPGLAQRIVEERQRRGRFDSPESLRSVLGMGPKKLAALRDLVAVGE